MASENFNELMRLMIPYLGRIIVVKQLLDKLDEIAEDERGMAVQYLMLSRDEQVMVWQFVNALSDATGLPPTPPPSTIRRKPERYWAFCEAVDSDGGNLKRYRHSTECWREETGLPLKEGYNGLQNRDAVDSFRNQGWGVVFGDREHREKGMRVIRPPKS